MTPPSLSSLPETSHLPLGEKARLRDGTLVDLGEGVINDDILQRFNFETGGCIPDMDRCGLDRRWQAASRPETRQWRTPRRPRLA